MKRFVSRKISRSRNRIEALNPCQKYSTNAGINPFADLINKLMLRMHLEGRSVEEAEKAAYHKIKMQADQRSAKSRQQRKRNKV